MNLSLRGVVNAAVCSIGCVAVATLMSACGSMIIVDPEWVFVSEEFKAPIGRSRDEIYTSMPIKADDSTTLELRAKVFERSRSGNEMNCLRVLLSFNLKQPISGRSIKVFDDRVEMSVNGFPLKFDSEYSSDPGSKLKRRQDWVWAAYEAPLDSIALSRDSLGYAHCTIDAKLDSVVMNGGKPVHVGHLQIYGIAISRVE